ncbi:hypothetical protein ACO0LF_03640 [Undibacterium sp. Di27W]|uniref:hypothetical protein n=1 Tax=Undibacterium sp. Di27W TaxID=3413036 RepID=UPI003BF1A99E
MTSKTAADERHEAQQQLNEFLKKSDYLNSMLTSHRLATSQAFAIVLKALIKHDPTLAPVILAAVGQIEAKAFKSPSVDGDRALIARAIREELKR